MAEPSGKKRVRQTEAGDAAPSGAPLREEEQDARALSTADFADESEIIDPNSLIEDITPKDVKDMDADRPDFAALGAKELSGGKRQARRIHVPAHRYTPLKKVWLQIYEPIVEHLKLQIRMNLKTRSVDLRTCDETEDMAALQKASEFVKAFLLGFDIDDALALLRMDELYIESFEVKDVKTLKGDHLARAVGRIAGKDGKVKYTIENASKTRIVLADTWIHVLGSHKNIKVARDSICALIMGSPPGKVFNNLRVVAKRLSERL